MKKKSVKKKSVNRKIHACGLGSPRFQDSNRGDAFAFFTLIGQSSRPSLRLWPIRCLHSCAALEPRFPFAGFPELGPAYELTLFASCSPSDRHIGCQERRKTPPRDESSKKSGPGSNGHCRAPQLYTILKKGFPRVRVKKHGPRECPVEISRVITASGKLLHKSSESDIFT